MAVRRIRDATGRTTYANDATRRKLPRIRTEASQFGSVTRIPDDRCNVVVGGGSPEGAPSYGRGEYPGA